MSSRRPTGRQNDHYPLGTEAEWDYEQSLYGVSAAALKAERTREKGDMQLYRISQAAAIRLLTTLESQHDLPAQNIYRDYFRNTMSEIRAFRNPEPGNFQD